MFEHKNQELDKMLNEPYLDSDKLISLIRKYRNCKDVIKKEKFRDEIFNNNVRFIRKIVIRNTRPCPEMMEDAFNEAVIAFLNGLDKFNPRKGNFHSYIAFWIQKAIYEEFVSRNIVNISRTDFFDKKLDLSRVKNGGLIYFDKIVTFNDGNSSTTMEDIIYGKQRHLEDDYSQQDDLIKVKRVMEDVLINAEKAIIYWRYLCPQPLILDEIGVLLKIHRERVRQIENRALWKIRKEIETNGNFRIYERFSKIDKYNFSNEQMEEMYHKTISMRKRE
jgi:RNA polymerase sigma factor (sigma-70 family)